jgi:hypothetical protein
MEEPDSVANMTPPTTARRLSLPGILPIHFSRVSIIFCAIPKRNMTSPIRRNKGTGRREKELMDREMLNTSWVSPPSPPQRK